MRGRYLYSLHRFPFLFILLATASSPLGGSEERLSLSFPRPLESYHDTSCKDLGEILYHRIVEEPFNLVAAILFACAIFHTFLTSQFLAMAHRWEHEHEEKKRRGEVNRDSISIRAGIFHFLGEVEAVFGIWAIALVLAITLFYSWETATTYLGDTVNYTEPMFVVVIMTMASTRPILKLAELILWKIARQFGGMLGAWWMTILTVGPLLGSLITEPAAMTICAYLLAQKFFDLRPSESFQYATLALLFVNISVGGCLTNFAAPPILMVAGPWNWSMEFMVSHFGWKAILGIFLANTTYYLLFRKELAELQKRYAIVRLKREIQARFIRRKELEAQIEAAELAVDEAVNYTPAFQAACEKIKQTLTQEALQGVLADGQEAKIIEEALAQRFEDIRMHAMKKTLPGLLPEDQRPPYRDPNWDNREDFVPIWMMLIHVAFMTWTVVNAHHPALFVGGFLFFLGVMNVTWIYQNRLDLKPPLLVGFFLSGLVIHGGLQSWWIEPILSTLGEIPLLIGTTLLTAFNDNAALTYLSTLVPGLTETMKYAVVAGAITGGGLTVIANAPNPAGQSILKRYFTTGVSPLRLLLAATPPTLIFFLLFFFFRS